MPMSGAGIFDEDDWGDTDDFFQQIDQVVLQHSKPSQVKIERPPTCCLLDALTCNHMYPQAMLS